MRNDIAIKAGGIIFNKNLTKVIMVLNRASYINGDCKWGLPKGHLVNYEKIHIGAKREIKEETGLQLSLRKEHRCIKINSCYYYIIILDKEYSLNAIDKNEIFMTKWVNIKDITKFNINYDTRSIFKVNKLNQIQNIINTQNVLKLTDSIY